MQISKPSYFDDFRCIAGDCPDSCCKEWAVQVDEKAAAFYRSLPGALGDRLREVLQDEDGETVMTIVDGRCPMWRQDGLCRIQADLGEQALCKTCREFPRLTHDYGDFVELGLELSCPEAARLIFTNPDAARIDTSTPESGEAEYDREAMEVLKATREVALSLLSDETKATQQMLAEFLLYGYQAQEELDGEEPRPFCPEDAVEAVREFLKPGDIGEILTFYSGLEILNPQWLHRLSAAPEWEFSPLCRPLLRYLVERYWLQAVSDYDLACRVKFMVVTCLVICALGGDFIATAQSYSKEIENNTENVEAVLDAAYSHRAFTDDKLLGMLLLSAVS